MIKIRSFPLAVGIPYRPRFKCEGEAWAAVANPVSALIGGLFSSNQGSKNRALARELNQANIEMQRETNALQQDMFREGNAFNSMEAEKARNWNAAGAQMQRLNAAGINPFAAAQQVSGANVANMSASSVSPPSLTAPRNDLIESHVGSDTAISMFSALAQGLKSLADARKAGVETRQLIGMYDDMLRKLRADANVSEHNDGLLALDLKFKNDEISKRFALLDAQAYKAYADAYKAYEEGDTQEYERLLKDAQVDHEKTKKLLTDKQVERYDDYMDAQVYELESRAKKESAEATTEEVLREPRRQNVLADTGDKMASSEEHRAGVRLKDTQAASIIQKLPAEMDLLEQQAYKAEQDGRLSQWLADTEKKMQPLRLQYQRLVNLGQSLDNQLKRHDKEIKSIEIQKRKQDIQYQRYDFLLKCYHEGLITYETYHDVELHKKQYEAAVKNNDSKSQLDNEKWTWKKVETIVNGVLLFMPK